MRLVALLAFSILAMDTLAGAATVRAAGDEGFLGRWNISIPGREGGPSRACWLEITRDGQVLKARFLSGGGSPFALKDFAIEKRELKFQHLAGQPPDQLPAVYRARVKGGRLEGTVVYGNEPPRSWTGVHPPLWPKQVPKKKPGQPVTLLNGKDLTGWLGQDPRRSLGWSVRDGVLVNDPPANNIYSEKKFKDFKVQVEFNLAPHSNSGVYLRGRHEIQINDDFGKVSNEYSHGAIYGFVAPRLNACKPAGEWQTLEATLIANRVTVILNGTKILDEAEIPAITGGALDAKEGEPGPIMLQGDHGLIQYRKVVVTPLR